MDEIFNRATVKESTSKVTCMILSKDISVVVQGPIHTQDNLTKRVLESVRTHLPNAELILSTWKGSQIDGLDCDILLLNDDPGAINGLNNVNRQIVSTRNGLQKATRTYAMKLRTDTFLTGTGFIDAFDKYPERREDFKVFERKIVIPTHYTRNPKRPYTYSVFGSFFHISDIFHFGLKKDLNLLWSAPLAVKWDMAPEQHIWISCLNLLNRNINWFKLNLYQQYKYSEISIINNFNIETPERLGIKLPLHLTDDLVVSCYTADEVELLVKKHLIEKSNFISVSTLLSIGFSYMLKWFEGRTFHFGFRRMTMNIYGQLLSKS